MFRNLGHQMNDRTRVSDFKNRVQIELLRWNDFHQLWIHLLSLRGAQALDLVEDSEWVTRTLGEDHINDFCASLYCYHLIQQVCLELFTGSQDRPLAQEIQITDKRHKKKQTERLSPAAIPLAILSGKKNNFHMISTQEYEIWRTRGRMYGDLIFDSQMRSLHEHAPDYFPKDLRAEWLSVRSKAVQRHQEIDNLILSRRFYYYHSDCEKCGRKDCYCKGKSTIELSFREYEHNSLELEMYQKIWFEPEGGVDTISVTANLGGFTTIYAVCRSLNFDWELVRQVAEYVNTVYKVVSIPEFKPRLIVVPKTRSVDYPGSRRLMTQLLYEANTLETKVLHMTHYGFCNGLSKPNELAIILRDLLYPHLKTTIGRVIIDFDSRAKKDVSKVLNEVEDWQNFECDLKP